MRAQLSLGNVLYRRSSAEAVPLQRRVFDVLVRTQGADDEDAVVALRNLATYLHWIGEDQEARELALDLVSRQERLLGHSDPETRYARELLETIEAALGGHGQTSG